MEETIYSCPEIRFCTLKSNTVLRITFAFFFITGETCFFIFFYFLDTSLMIHLYRCNSFVGKNMLN